MRIWKEFTGSLYAEPPAYTHNLVAEQGCCLSIHFAKDLIQIYAPWFRREMVLECV